jgi:hypothetical protein
MFPAIRHWLENARWCAANPERVLAIGYDGWVQSASSRAEILARIGLENLDDDIGAVSAIGGGSSFDGLTFDGKAGDMAVMERWREILEDQLLRDILRVALSDDRVREVLQRTTPREFAAVLASLESE